ncbi:MAG: VOC family protein [Pseudomonadota bacterium]
MATLAGIDHIHIYVADRAAAATWFDDVLGLKVEEAFKVWAVEGGPLTIGDESGTIHIALFEREEFSPSSAIAFRADADNFLRWKEDLERKEILERCVDHDLAWSLYFSDPDGNCYEITSYDHEAISSVLNA